jgi:hypothetical protein
MNLWFILDNYDALVVGLDVGLVVALVVYFGQL